jgi:Domain of unknown function (DUF4920)
MRSVLTVVLALGLASACSKPDAPAPAAAPESAATSPAAASPAAASPAPAGEWAAGKIHRGAPFAPSKFAGQVVRTQGLVARACAKKGCWMELKTVDGTEAKGMRVTFKDYGFFVPLDSEGARATLEGTVEVKTLSADDAKHLEAEGARITRNDKGEAVELAFVASGVELTR